MGTRDSGGCRKTSRTCRKDFVQSDFRISHCCLVWLPWRGWFGLLSNGHLCLMYVLKGFVRSSIVALRGFVECGREKDLG